MIEKTDKKIFRKNLFYIILFIIFIFIFPFLKSFFSNSETKTNPSNALVAINKTTNSVANIFSPLKNIFSSKEDLVNEVKNLEKQIEDQQIKIAELENNLFGENKNSATDLIISKKIFSDFTTMYESVLLNKGERDGAEKDDLVFIYPDKVVGKLISVNSKTSLLSLFSKDKVKTEGVVKVIKTSESVSENTTKISTSTSSTTNEVGNSSTSSTSSTTLEKISHIVPVGKSSNIIIDVYGAGSGDFYALVPDNMFVEEGAKIYLAEDESKILGEVVKVEKRDASFFQLVLIKGYYNTRLNDNFYILKK